jgi:hypothetical protein
MPTGPVQELAFKPPSQEPAAAVKSDLKTELPGSSTQPAVPGGVIEYFLPNNLSFTEAFGVAGISMPEQAENPGLIYRPALLAQANVRYLQRKYDLDYEQNLTALTASPDRRGNIRWEEVLTNMIDPDSLESRPDPRARFGSLEAPFTEAKIMSAMKKDFQDWVYHSSSVTVRANEELDIYAGPEVSQADFRGECADAAQEGRDKELDKVSEKFERKMDSIVQRLKREQRELEEDRSELSQRKMEEYGTHAETVLSLFGRRRKSLSRSLSKRRMTEKAEADVKESIQAIEEYEKQIAELERDRQAALQEVNERWEEIASQITEIEVTPFKKDILLDIFGVAWFPYYVARIGDRFEEIPGYGS